MIGPRFVLVERNGNTVITESFGVNHLMVTMTQRIIDFLYPPFQIACFGLVWLAFGYVSWVLVKGMVGDDFVRQIMNVASF